jgi:glycerol uptake facilitator-like aquaporin
MDPDLDCKLYKKLLTEAVVGFRLEHAALVSTDTKNTFMKCLHSQMFLFVLIFLICLAYPNFGIERL